MRVTYIAFDETPSRGSSLLAYNISWAEVSYWSRHAVVIPFDWIQFSCFNIWWFFLLPSSL